MGVWDIWRGTIGQGTITTNIKKIADLRANILSPVWGNIDLIAFGSFAQSTKIQVKTTTTESFTGLWGLNIHNLELKGIESDKLDKELL